MTKDSEYTTVQIPNDLLAEVDALIGKHGFKSRPEVVKEALRALLDQYKEA
jgi:metal-responsive CopG/Arc/MetJ family transcriptional regulator